jgi:hypothetical protein
MLILILSYKKIFYDWCKIYNACWK